MFCDNCGTAVPLSGKFCSTCGNKMVDATQDSFSKEAQSVGDSFNDSKFGWENDHVALSEYYRSEFIKIKLSNETYKGKWNWEAFFFGPLWALIKGAWLSAVVCFVICLATGGLIGVFYWFVYGIRGNYIYYCVHEKKSQQVI